MHSKGKRPTHEQRKIISKANLDTYVWLVRKCTSTIMELVNKETGEKMTIDLKDIC